MTRGKAVLKQWRTQVASYLHEPQHRNTFLLTANTLMGAAAGLVFWLLLARIMGLPPAEIGIGYAIISLGTLIGVLAKGGLDTALIRWVPNASGPDGGRLLGLGALIGSAAGLAIAAVLAVGSITWTSLPAFTPSGWSLVAAIGVLLVVTWLQDAYFVGLGTAAPTLHRNVVFSAARLVLPVPFVLLAVPYAVAGTWAVALLLSAIASLLLMSLHRRPRGTGGRIPRPLFLRSAGRNITGSAAEFLPGLLLVPIILAVLSADAAGYFGIAWTAAAMLFLFCAAISRSALSAMVQRPEAGLSTAIRRAVRHLLLVAAPAALLGIVLAPQILGIFGPGYATEGAFVFMILCASTLFIAPSYLYLAVLRARERAVPLVAFPAGMVIALLVIAPTLATTYGLAGAGLAWLLANLPFGVYATIKLRQEAQEVVSHPSNAPHLAHPQTD